jgi:hypothetical protein
VSHVVSDEAVQLHSGGAVTAMASLPPAASIVFDGASTDTWHFTGDGPVDVLDLDSHPRLAIARPSTSDGPRMLGGDIRTTPYTDIPMVRRTAR